MRRIAAGLLAGAAALASGSSHAAAWIEAVHGDLSNSGATPSSLVLDAGSNIIQGGFGAPDLDYLTIFVPVGHTLNAIITGPATGTGLSRSFLGVQAGTVMTVPPTAGSAAGLLGWVHFGGADGVNLLPAMGVPNLGSTGFTGPLAAGAYTFWINETLSDPGLTYDFNFQVQPVPLPGALVLLLSGLGLVARVRRR